MVTMFLKRALVIFTVIAGLLMICSANFFLVVAFILLAIACVIMFKGMPTEEINKILMAEKFKKIGIDIDE